MTSISCICCTYGRVAQLEEAIACFLNQKYDGQKELIVYNTLAEQTLAFDHPEVRIINAATRPATIGETRNEAVSIAKGDLIVTWDDDDIYLPLHLHHLGSAFQPGHGWVRMARQFYAEGGRIKSITHGTMNTVAYSRRAWVVAERYRAMNTGEDHDFYSRISQAFTGATVQLADDELTFIYGWGNGLYHLSGEGPDKPGAPSGTERAEKWAKAALAIKRIPSGVIQLQPQLKADYERMAQAFTGAMKRIKSERIGKVGLICLGRYGDVLNILPVAKYIADVWGKPRFYIARQFADMLDGVSYVEPVPLDVPYNQVKYAETVAKGECQHVLNASVHGENFAVEKLTPAFNKEAWRLVGLLHEFDLHQFNPLVIQRDPVRESTLLASLGDLTQKQPIALLSINCSLSSPMPNAAEVHRQIAEMCQQKGYHVIDLCQIRAERLFDLLAVMHISQLLITTDTAHLHLATASTIPVIALTNEQEWLGSIPRYATVASGHYPDYFNIVRAGLEVASEMCPSRRPAYRGCHGRAQSKVFHAFEQHPPSSRDRERMERAQATWPKKWTAVPLCDPYPVDARSIGDARPLPMLKDVLWPAIHAAEENDIVVWTNSDVTLHPLLPELLCMFCSIHEVCTAMRMDFMPHRRPNLEHDPDEIAPQCQPHMGRDLMAATKHWWLEHWNEIPNAILGAPLFDLHLAAIVRRDKAMPFTRHNCAQRFACCELPPGYVLHEFHRATWSDLPPTNPSQQHNSKEFQRWAKQHLPELQFTGEGHI